LTFEKYKSAKTLRKTKKLGAESKDIGWDYERGYIDFSPLADQRLGHWNEDMIEKMVKHRAVDYSLTDRARCVCEVCRTAKATRKHVPVKREDLPDQTKLFQRIWTDLKGKVCRDFWGNQYIVTFTCKVSRWSFPYFAKSKSDVKKCYSDFLKDVELTRPTSRAFSLTKRCRPRRCLPTPSPKERCQPRRCLPTPSPKAYRVKTSTSIVAGWV
jgi:hypothetical protein